MIPPNHDPIIDIPDGEKPKYWMSIICYIICIVSILLFFKFPLFIIPLGLVAIISFCFADSILPKNKKHD